MQRETASCAAESRRLDTEEARERTEVWRNCASWKKRERSVGDGRNVMLMDAMWSRNVLVKRQYLIVTELTSIVCEREERNRREKKMERTRDE